jgi:hypothetical protein
LLQKIDITKTGKDESINTPEEATKKTNDREEKKRRDEADGHVQWNKGQGSEKNNPVDSKDFSVGQRVCITRDRIFQFNRRPSQMSKTQWEGRVGVVTKVTRCYVWVDLDDKEGCLKKRKENVSLYYV